MMSLIFHAIFGDLPYRKDRRSHWPMALSWLLALGCWLPLIALWILYNGPEGVM